MTHDVCCKDNSTYRVLPYRFLPVLVALPLPFCAFRTGNLGLFEFLLSIVNCDSYRRQGRKALIMNLIRQTNPRTIPEQFLYSSSGNIHSTRFTRV